MSSNAKQLVSTFANANDVQPKDLDVSVILEIIRGRQGKVKERVERIRNKIETELTQHGDYKKAKTAVAKLKNALPAVTWSARFRTRDKDVPLEEKIAAATGRFCGDLDGLHGDLPVVRERILTSPHLVILFVSPSGDGLKTVFRVPADASQHLGSYLAVKRHIADLCGEEIARKLDSKSRDITRLCFLSYDPNLYYNPKAVEITPLPEPEKTKHQPADNLDLSERGHIAEEILGEIDWESETRGYLPCPGKHLHTAADKDHDCRIDLDGAPTLHCFHDSCSGIVAGVNHELRSRIGIDEADLVTADDVETGKEVRLADSSVVTAKAVEGQSDTPAEAPAPYEKPPLDLLPSVLQDYILAAAECVGVDVSWSFFPFLSALGTAIGNARSICLKAGYIEPPNFWSTIIGRSGERKNPILKLAFSPILDHERELHRLNKDAQELYEEELEAWASKKKNRGPKPQPPAIQTCLMGDLTIEILTSRLQDNPHGICIYKDELGHFFTAFDQYRAQKGSDVAHWCSLHTGDVFALDRRTDNRHIRIWYPRVNITGAIQPSILRRVLTPEYFERGLAARFLFVLPNPRRSKWTDAVVPDAVTEAMRELFEKLWDLEPIRSEHGESQPLDLAPDRRAKEIFVAFYNECGGVAFESSDHEAAAWNKLPGYAARCALVGQLARDPRSVSVAMETMQAACDLMRWQGRETTRVYAALVETPFQREQRTLLEFIEHRGGSVTVREVMRNHWRLKSQREQTEFELNMLVKAGFGKWREKRSGTRGPKAVYFQLTRASTP
jgi:Protein of unknown function (DUF3987)/VirE N-terminal domain